MSTCCEPVDGVEPTDVRQKDGPAISITHMCAVASIPPSHFPSPSLQAQYAAVPSYCAPVDGVDQKNGPAPLASYLNRSLSPVAAGDARVLSVTYSLGRVVGVYNVGYGQR